MKTSGAVALALALVANCYADTFSHNMNPREYYEARFYDWMAEYNIKFADGAEYVRRLQNFADADDRIETHNAKDSKFRMDHNQYSHLTWPEFRQHKAIGRPLLTKPATRDIVPEDSVAVMERRVLDNPKLAGLFAWSDIGAGKSADKCATPNAADSIDWTTKGAVTPVKNQGQCGSCWAFSTTGALEGAYFKTYKELVSMSEQSLVDCDTEDQGCNGGLMDFSFDWISKNGGICREEDYPYQGSGGQCQRQCQKIKGSKIDYWCDVPVNNMEALMAAVTQQPVAVAIEADQTAFQFYSGGVLTGTCGTSLDHGVLLVGYGVAADGTKYWKVKNSWGADWGDHGYILLERGAPQEGGECGILMSASYPVLKK